MAKTDTHIAVIEITLHEDDNGTPLGLAKTLVKDANDSLAMGKPVKLKKFYVKGQYDVTYKETERRQVSRRFGDRLRDKCPISYDPIGHGRRHDSV